jgi:type VI secretion system protein ImpA
LQALNKSKTSVKTTKVSRHAAGAAHDAGANEPEWLRPVSAVEPCGPHLEYDAEYAILSTRMMPQAEAQYGDFVSKPEGPDWADVERDCRRLLTRSKDISVLIWLARCRTHLAGAEGLAEALGMLLAVVQRFPDDVHPQLLIDGETDPAVRGNALAALGDPEGLIADIRDLVVTSGTGTRLTLRDVERALSIPRATEAMSAEAVQLQLDELGAQGHPSIRALAAAATCLEQIDRWSHAHLDDHAPDLQVSLRLLGYFNLPVLSDVPTDPACEVVPAPNENASTSPTVPTHVPVTPVAISVSPQMPDVGVSSSTSFVGTHVDQREQVRACLQAARTWLEQHEPSSPVAILLKQAERFLGKRYSEVAHAIPADLLARWDTEG